MPFSPFRRWPSWAASTVIATSSFLAGCHRDGGPPTRHDVLARAASIANAPGAIEFHRHGEPMDLGELPSGHLSLDRAVEETLRHDPEIQSSLARVHVAMADADQARLFPNPVLSVAVRFPENGGTATIEAGLAADLLSLLTRPRRIDAADKRLQAAASEALTTVLDRLTAVQEQYAAVQALDAQLVVLDEQRRLIDRLLELARSRVEAGESSRLDVLTLDTERVRVEAEVLEVRARRHDERLGLTRLLGRPSGQADWELDPWAPPPAVSLDERSWIAAALNHRPELQARRWELAALGDEAALARWTALEGSEVGLEAEREEDWTVGPAISTPLPLFDWGQARSSRAEAERIDARHRLVQSRRQVIEEVRRALASLTTSRESLAKMREELIPVLERRHAHARDAYQAGLSGAVEVLLAEQELQQGRGRLVEMQQQVAVAQSRLHRAAGGPGVAATVAPPATQPGEPSTNDTTNQNVEIR